VSQESAEVLGPPAGRIARSAGALVFVSALTKPVNFLREAIVAALFGTSAARDAFLVAWTIPNLASLLVTEGLSQVLIAIVIGDLGKGRQQEAWRTVSTLLNLLSLAMIALSLGLIVAAPALVAFLAPSFGAEARALAIDLSRVMAFCVLFLGLANLFTGVLNAQQRFVWPALAPIVLSGTAIVVMLLGWRALGVYSLALGMLVGTLGMVLWQVPAALRAGARYTPCLDLRQEGVQQFARLAGPLLLGTVIYSIPGIVDRMVASGLPVGSLSALDYAGRVMQLVFSLFVPTLLMPLFPTLSLFAAKGDQMRFRRGLVFGIQAVEAIALPITVWLVVLAQPIVRLVYQRGEFTAVSTALTAGALTFYAPGFALASWWVLFQAFYARQDTMSRVQMTSVMTLVNATLDVLLGWLIGVRGLALASSLGVLAGLVYGLWLFHRKTGEALWRECGLIAFLGKVALAAALSGLVAWAIYSPLAGRWGVAGLMAQVLTLAIAGGGATAAYAGLLWLFRVHEVAHLWRRIRAG
jgi:putative peptidoglycan lipid II flippase